MTEKIDCVKWVSSLEKIFSEKEPAGGLGADAPRFLRGEAYSLQCAFHAAPDCEGVARVSLSGPLAPCARIWEVRSVPVRFAGRMRENGEEKLLAPGLYPDLLRAPGGGRVRLCPGQWQSLWITVECPDDIPAGRYSLTLTLAPEEGAPVETACALTLCDARLPAQTLLHTEWFHADCLADFYRVEPWSEAHWRIVEKFLTHYGKMGMNMVLMPVLTPPLDTAVGGERTTVQLVDVYEEEGRWRFDFTKAERFARLCARAGIQTLEIAHLFTQWGARCAPKVLVRRDGALYRRFGWETPSDDPAYLGFLEQLLRALVKALGEWGWQGRAVFHLSDEPGEDILERYASLRQKLSAWVAPYPVMDALSDYDFYERGAADRAVPSMDSLPLFAGHGVKPLWTYYCSGQNQGTPNRYIAMPAVYVRVLGVLLYVYDAAGFLHWGYNFYNSQYSLRHIDPYGDTDADGAFPAGDAFLVYPGEGGEPENSMRMMLLREAMQDLRALRLLEERWGRERVLEFLTREAGGPLTATRWPRDPDFLRRVREKGNAALEDVTR